MVIPTALASRPKGKTPTGTDESRAGKSDAEGKPAGAGRRFVRACAGAREFTPASRHAGYTGPGRETCGAALGVPGDGDEEADAVFAQNRKQTERPDGLRARLDPGRADSDPDHCRIAAQLRLTGVAAIGIPAPVWLVSTFSRGRDHGYD